MEEVNNVLGLSGLKNIGNTCYMNSIVQSLASLDIFRSYLITNKFVPMLFDKLYEERNDQQADYYHQQIEKCTVFQLATLFKSMWNQNRTTIPCDLKRNISAKNATFMGFDQHDSHEFLNTILDIIHDELKTSVELEYQILDHSIDEFITIKNEYLEKERSKTLRDDEFKKYNQYFKDIKKNSLSTYINGSSYVYWENYIKNSFSIITHLFTGLFLNVVICQKCQNVSESFEPFNVLSVELGSSKRTTLDDCLARFTGGEVLHGLNQYYCSECNENVDAIKKISIWKAPEVLIIHLKRFKTSGVMAIKLRTQVDIPSDNFDITNYTSQYKEYNPYQLQAISSHTGTCRGGHYVAFCRNSLNGDWYEFNDDSPVQHYPSDDIGDYIKSDDAYVLFYVQKR